MNLYNEFSGPMAAWLRELIKCGHIAPGTVDETDINKLDYAKLKTFTQCHFFAGIGGWSAALRLAGWPDDRPVWTGSCPCQPFSIAGKRKAEADERHVWPAFRAAIAECRPATVFGEQVASEDGRIWLAGVRSDLEALGYVVGAADLCAAGVSAPHIRQRLYWVAYASGQRVRTEGSAETEPSTAAVQPQQPGEEHGLVNADGYHRQWWSGPLQVGWNCIEGEIERSGRKYRAQWRIKPSLPLLLDGVRGRVAQLCGFGNAIVPVLAAEFILASEEAFQSTVLK